LIAEEGKKLPLIFSIEQKKDFFTLDIQSKYNKRNIMVHPEANIVNVDSVFYLLNNKQFNLAQLLIETMNNMTEEPFKLTKDDLTSFYSLILPNLKKFFIMKLRMELKRISNMNL